MSPVVRRSAGRLTRLLTVLLLCVASQCGASQPEPPASVDLTSEALSQLIARHVRSEIQPVVNRLASRIDAIEYGLSDIEARLDTLYFKQDRFEVNLVDVTSRVDSLSNTLDDRIDEMNSRLTLVLSARIDEEVARVDTPLHQVMTLKPLDGLSPDQDNSSRLDSVEDLASKTDGQQLQSDDGPSEVLNALTQPPRDGSELPPDAQSGV